MMCVDVLLTLMYMLHNWCQEDTEVKRILTASRHDDAFDAALLEQVRARCLLLLFFTQFYRCNSTTLMIWSGAELMIASSPTSSSWTRARSLCYSFVVTWLQGSDRIELEVCRMPRRAA
jgi:hypothetical protein